MACKKHTAKKYQTRKSPAFPAQECKGVTKKGKDGVYVSKADKRGIYRWIKARSTQKQKGRFYDIHDNGGRPFRVFIDGSSVSIYKGTNDSDEYNKLIKKVNAKEIYIGKGQYKSFLGNSILLQLVGNNYLYIGSEIYEFKMEDEVKAYYSLVGNSDVPYPVLLGTTYVYFMLDHCYVPRSEFSPSMTTMDWEDAYSRYYGWKDPMTGESYSFTEQMKMEKKGLTLKEKCKKMNGFHMIAKRSF
jgi:hypothetical protein